MQHSSTLELTDRQHSAMLELDDMQHDKSVLSPLAVASLTMGVLSLLIMFMRSVDMLFVGVQIVLAIAAIVTGIFGMKTAREYAQRGHTLAYAGLICGGNSLLFIIVHEVVTLFLTPDGGSSGGRLGG
ncbi:MAG: DUF4190 domain-containing protein [Candidatus Brocadiales bacterium]